MTSNHRWRLLIILFIVGWAAFELWPPKGRNLITDFERRADFGARDATFTNILSQARELERKNPDRVFGNLKDAVGTNDITRYFPFVADAKEKKDPNAAVLNRLQRDAAGKIKLGLDLQGGTSFLVGMDTSKLNTDTNAANNLERRSLALSHAVEVLRKRVDKFGVAEPVIQQAGDDQILIQLPGATAAEMESYRNQIQKAAFLEFRMVHPDNQEMISKGIVPPGYELLRQEIKNDKGDKTMLPTLVKKGAERGLTGKFVKSAMASRDPATGRLEIHFTLDSVGADLFGQITTEFQPKGEKSYQLAIVLDGELNSAPRINGPITGGTASITGNFDVKEAQELANTLENPLEAPVKIIAENTVDPSLGKDTIKSGVTASIVGTIAVAGFMAAYYLLSGVVANIALLLNIVILLGVMCSVGTTLTMPGIAGIVLTIGMAVDANVLIFERIREESAKGKSLRGALSAGYERAFGTIFDSHVTTLISSIILYKMGTGTIKGFGVALTIGVAASLFTSLVVTRLIFDFLLIRGWVKSLPMMHIIRAVKLNFMSLAKPAFLLSWTIILIGIGYGVFVRGHSMFGKEFVGGDDLKLRFNQSQKVETDKLRAALTAAGINDPMIQYQKEITGTVETLRVTTDFGASDQAAAALAKSFPATDFKVISVDKVGASIGREIQKTAIVAALLSLFGILIYVAFRYEFSFAVGAVIAVIHDVLMTIGCYCLTGLFGHGREFNGPMVAAVLTIIGFSINDTIVIFDRIREDLRLGVRGTFKEIINQALNQTLSRTIITSGTVFLATLALYIFGGGAVNDFAFTFLVGILTGTYSSIYIASALVLWWHKGQRPNIGASTVAVNTTGEPVRPAAAARV